MQRFYFPFIFIFFIGNRIFLPSVFLVHSSDQFFHMLYRSPLRCCHCWLTLTHFPARLLHRARSQESWSMVSPSGFEWPQAQSSWKLRNLPVTITFWKPLFSSSPFSIHQSHPWSYCILSQRWQQIHSLLPHFLLREVSYPCLFLWVCHRIGGRLRWFGSSSSPPGQSELDCISPESLPRNLLLEIMVGFELPCWVISM